MSRTVSIATLGCKTNQFESAAMEEQLRTAGYRLVPFEAGAELVIVNTCTVTAKTDAQSRNLIRRARRFNPRARVLVTGCYAQIDPQALGELPGVAVVLGNEEKRDLLGYLTRATVEGSDTTSDAAVAPAATLAVSDIRQVAAARPLELSSFAERSRAFVQIQNGCDAFCSYCIIPYARGRSRSVPPEAVLAQLRTLSEQGYAEVVLTGIHIGGYGLDLAPPSSLSALLERIEADTAIPRLRLGSIEPTELNEPLIAQLARSSRLCPHLHIPLQSGSDSVLRRMNRHYDRAFFRRLLASVSERLPEAAIGLDVIVGFPGESEAEFAETVQLLEELPISHLHVFPYSRRPGTPAAALPEQLPGDVKRARVARLTALGEAKQRAYADRFLGRCLEVVVEGSGRRALTRNYLALQLVGGAARPGELRSVRLERDAQGGLIGRLDGTQAP